MSERPHLKVMHSRNVFIKTYNRVQADNLVKKCPQCPFVGEVCSGNPKGGDAKLIAEAPSGKEVLDFLNQAPCKPTFNMNNLSILGGSYLIKQYYNSKARISVGNK